MSRLSVCGWWPVGAGQCTVGTRPDKYTCLQTSGYTIARLETCQHLNRLFSFGGCLPCQCQCGWCLEELGAVAGGGGSVSRDNCWRWLLAAAGLWLASSDQWPSATWPGHQSSSSSHQPQQQVTPHRQHQQQHQHQHQQQQ